MVVGVGGSDGDRGAVEEAARRAERRRSVLRLVHMAQPLAPRWGPPEIIADLYAWDNERCAQVLATAAGWARAVAPDIEIQTTAAAGNVAGILIAESRRAGLTVVGTHARGGLTGHLSASVACQVAAHAASPVLVVRSAGEAGRQPVVVGVDGSATAEAALAYAIEDAAARSVPVIAVFAWSNWDVDGLGPIRPEQFSSVAEGDKALRLLTEATEGFTDRYPDLVIERRVVHDPHPAQVLSETATTVGAGLIVVGTRGHGGFLGLRLGSTADTLIRYADTPVMIIRDEYPGRL